MNGKKLEDLTYADDLLDRNEEFGKGVLSLIENSKNISSNNSLVFALDSGWGTGKTVFMHMFMNDLKENHYKTIYYNAWENDDWDNALIPIVAKIKDIVSQETTKEEKSLIDKIEEQSNKVGVFLENNKKSLAFNVIGQIIKGLTKFDIKEIKDIWDKANKECNLIEDYDNFIGAKNGFKDDLKKLAEDKKVIFLIDELDRCKPTFAIETLEVIKHFFDIENFIFVFALDMQQLSHSIATIYGQEMDAPGYLRRFFDMQLRIPTPSIKLYLKNTIANYFSNEKLEIYKNTLLERIPRIFETFNLSLRDINIILNSFKLFIYYHKIYNSANTDIFNLYLFLITLKYKKPLLYDTLFYENNYKKEDFLGYYRINQIIREFINAFKDGRLQLEYKDLPKDSSKTREIFDKLILDKPKANEKAFQYFERQLEIIKFV